MKCPSCGFIIKTKKVKVLKNKHLDFVLLTSEEFQKIKKKWPRTHQQKIKSLDDALAIHGYKYQSHYRVLLKWNEDTSPEYEQKEVAKKPDPPRISTPKIRALTKQMTGLVKCFNPANTPKEREDAKLEIKKIGKQINELIEKEKAKLEGSNG